MKYIFDIDGTLTPSRLRIDQEFETFFLKWMKNKEVILVTGSDKDKTIEQVGEKIWTRAKRVYQSCGNAVYERGMLVRKNDFELTFPLRDLLEEMKSRSTWKERYGNHIEERIGLINFSIIGRDCPQEAREKYFQWDKKEQEREYFCWKIQEEFPELEASVGGEISIDIYPKGQNKAQVLNDIRDNVIFFGDRCEPGGNDFPIVERLEREKERSADHVFGDLARRKFRIHKVKSYKDTWDILKTY